ncbi:hypothetical protein Tco_1408805 [Tanacetum coccineum]
MTPMGKLKSSTNDEYGEEVDVHMYRSMIGSLMYITSARPDIMFAVCQPKLGLWYPKDSPFDLVAYTDSDYARASLDRKSTTGGCCGKMAVFDVSKVFTKSFWYKQLEGMPNHNRIYIAPSHTKKIFGNMRRVGKGFSGRETPLFQTMVVQAQAKMGKGGGPRRQETMGDTIAQTRFENVSKHYNDPLLAQKKRWEWDGGPVVVWEKTKTTQAEEIVSLKRRVKKLEQKKRSRTYGLKRLYKVGLTARVESFGDEENDADLFDVSTLTGDEVLAEQEVAIKDHQLKLDEEMTLKLQAEIDEDERLTWEKDEANCSLNWMNTRMIIQAMFDVF